MKRLLLLVLLLTSLLAVAGACETYEAPPRPAIVGLTSGVLTDPRAPLLIDFGTPIDPDTLFVKVALLEPDVEGNLKDEDTDPETTLNVLIQRDPLDGDIGVKAEIDPDGTRLVLNLDSALPVGPKLVLIVEGGLRSRTTGRISNHRVEIPFSYVVQCVAGASAFESGVYFLLLDVAQPLGTQIQVLAVIDVDPNTGALISQFSNADRNTAQKCPMSCKSSEVCRLVPAPECVLPSERAGTIEEWPDFIPNPTPPSGYSFLVQGCAVDDGAAIGVLTAPATLVVESPRVTVEGLTMTSSFAKGPDGIVRATGSLTADVVRLGTNPLGAGKGSMTAIRLPDDRVPPNLPLPPARSDAGARGGPDGGS